MGQKAWMKMQGEGSCLGGVGGCFAKINDVDIDAARE